MTVSHHPGGLLLRLSPEELSAARSREDLLSLIRTALRRARLPLPPNPEILCFQAREEAVLFLFSRPAPMLFRGNFPSLPC